MCPIVPLQHLCSVLLQPPGCPNSFSHHYSRIIALPFFLVRPFYLQRAKRKLDGLLHSRIFSLRFVFVFNYIIGFGVLVYERITPTFPHRQRLARPMAGRLHQGAPVEQR